MIASGELRLKLNLILHANATTLFDSMHCECFGTWDFEDDSSVTQSIKVFEGPEMVKKVSSSATRSSIPEGDSKLICLVRNIRI